MNESEERGARTSLAEAALIRCHSQIRPNSQVMPESPGSPKPRSVTFMTERSISELSETEEPSQVMPESPDSPKPRSVTFRTDRSMSEPLKFRDGPQDDEPSQVMPESPDSPKPRSVTFRTDRSMSEPLKFRDGPQDDEPSQVMLESPDSPKVRSVFRTDRSKSEPLMFKDGPQTDEPSKVKLESPDPPLSRVSSMKSDHSESTSNEFSDGEETDEQRAHRQKSEVLSKRPVKKHQADVDSIFMHLEENIVTFMKNELKKLRKMLDSQYPENVSEEPTDDEKVMTGADDGKRNSNTEAFRKITLNVLRSMKQEQLADSLQSKTLAGICRHKLKSGVKKKSQCVYEGIAKAGNPTLLNQIYTELYITEGGTGDVNEVHEVRQIETTSRKPDRPETTIRHEDIFKASPGRDAPIRTVMTKGVAGIGKTVLTQKWTLDWAEDKANQDVLFTFPLTFRELNVLKERKFSLVELVHHFFPETKEAGICRFEEFQVVFIFDGLDECRLPLDFTNNQILTDVTESTSVDVLLTNLIGGNLLPSARLWITTRPAAANQIPPGCVDMVTEVRGFTDPQKEEYFRKRFRDEEQARRIISHIQTSRSLHIMCHIPVFCWITATVLEHVLEIREGGELPKTLTEMYIHFLVVQTKRGNIKYGTRETHPAWNSENKKTILSLGKLAFEQLERGNLIFYEEDLVECGIDIKTASIYSGLFTAIFRKEYGLNEDKVFCFVHLSILEFLAALYVLLTFLNTGVDPLRVKRSPFWRKSKLLNLYQTAVDKSLQSRNGHLDLFVRFLLGLSLENNQTLLRGLMKKTERKEKVKEKLVQYIQKKIRDCHSPEESINLFHCLNELNDNSLVEEIQQFLRSGSVQEKKLSPSQWSALVFILLSSQKDLDVFDLKKFSASDSGLKSLLPVVKASTTALLSGCDLSWRSCEALVSVFTSKNSNLRELDLSNNDLHDTGLELLSAGLTSPNCKLEVLRLSGCMVTDKGSAALALALSSIPNHLKELDLSFNHPGDSAIKQLSARLKDPHWNLEKLTLDHCGKCRLQPPPQRYFCRLLLDPNTANRNLSLLDDNTGVMVVKEKQPYPDHAERFESWKQLLCSDALTGRCYWEVQWEGSVNIGVTYKSIKRSGNSDDGCIGWNDQSWSLICSPQSYTAWHNNTATDIATPPSDSNRVGVYLDWPAGTVSFYCLPTTVSSGKPSHLHTFHCTFTEPVCPVFGFGQLPDLRTDPRLLPSSVKLLEVE